jgi:hypothetical protein
MGRKRIDITGFKFGNLTVVEQAGLGSDSGVRWKCSCACGGITVASGSDLRRGVVTNCPSPVHRRKTQAAIDITGQRFGKLLALDRHEPNIRGTTRWKFLCDCGKAIVAPAYSAITHRKLSCGCDKPPPKKYPRNNLRKWPIKNWAQETIVRYDKQCDICDSEENLNAHHLKSATRFPEEMYDLMNGVCLCYEHHKQFHRKYSKDKFTQWDYFKYKSEMSK